MSGSAVGSETSLQVGRSQTCRIEAFHSACKAVLSSECCTCNIAALGLLDAIHSLGKDDKDGDLAVQVEVFRDHKHRDEETMCKLQELDVHSASDVFNALSSKVQRMALSNQSWIAVQSIG